MQPAIQIPDLLHDVVNLALVRALDLARLSNRQVQRELDGAMDPIVAQAPRSSARRHVLRRHAEPVLARVGGGEGEAAGIRAPLRDDPVVVVEGLFHRDQDADVGFGDVGFGRVVPDLGFVVAW